MKEPLSRLATLTPISLRGVVLLAFLGFLYLEYVHTGSDIIATVLVATLLVTFLLTFLIALVAGSKLKNTARITLLPTGGSLVHAGVPVPVKISLNPVRIPPLYTLTAKPIFAEEYSSLVQASFGGYAEVDRSVETRITFPHRGHWSVTSIHWVLSDCFGLTLFQWHTAPAPLSQTVTVNPPKVITTPLPLVASSYREGDAIPHPMDHNGDYYDIKRYHPSDGMNKLLWKLFARSGDLLARKPEESVSPEGQIVAFCMAQRPDDALATIFYDYIKRAYDIDMSIIATCLGAQDEEPARTADEMYSLLIDSALQIPASFPAKNARIELQIFISKVKKLLGVSSLANVLVFISESCLSRTVDAQLAVELGEIIVSEGAKPIFCVLPLGERKAASDQHAPLDVLQPILKLCVNSTDEKQAGKSHLSQFKNACDQQGWSILEGGAR